MSKVDYTESYYEKDAAGNIVEVRFVGGERVHISVDPALKFSECRDANGQPTGRYAAFRDTQAYRAAKDVRSHDQFIYGAKGVDFSKDSAQEARQNMRRVSKLSTMLNTMVLDRVSPATVPGVQRITDREFEKLSAEYRQASAEGRASECDFQPLSSYVRKLEMLKLKGVHRPLLQGEVGMRGSTILCLEDGYCVGDRVSFAGAHKKEDE